MISSLDIYLSILFITSPVISNVLVSIPNVTSAMYSLSSDVRSSIFYRNQILRGEKSRENKVDRVEKGAQEQKQTKKKCLKGIRDSERCVCVC